MIPGRHAPNVWSNGTNEIDRKNLAALFFGSINASMDSNNRNNQPTS